jgi:hypothetical protein
MRMLPFLYLPDAITLILLLVVFGMLRKAAIDHIRQELSIICKEMLLYWLNHGLDFRDRGYLALCDSMESTIGLVPRLSPGRLVFLYGLRRKTEGATSLPFPDPSREVYDLIECTPDAKGREKLKRLHLEMNLALGTFFLVGSLSGWFLLLILVLKIFKRTISNYQDHRTDVFFDMFERVLVNHGRQALQIGSAIGQSERDKMPAPDPIRGK